MASQQAPSNTNPNDPTPSPSQAEVLSLATPSAELTHLLQTQPLPSYDFTSPTRLIYNLRENLKRWHTPPVPGVDEREVFFPARDGVELRCKVFSPSALEEETAPGEGQRKSRGKVLIMLYHGGGFTIGSPESLAPTCRLLVQRLGAVCVAPAYRQGPEDPFPTGIWDGWDAYRYVMGDLEGFVGGGGGQGAAGSSSKDVPSSEEEVKVVVGGVSAGGKIANVVAHLARDNDVQPQISGVWLAAASVVDPSTVPERYKHLYLARSQPAVLDAPITNLRLFTVFEEAFKPDKASQLTSPMNWSTGHKGLPRTFLQVCGLDVVRDDALIYERMLREEDGVETRLVVYPGWPHIFFQVFPRAEATRRFWEDAVRGFEWLIEGKEEE